MQTDHIKTVFKHIYRNVKDRTIRLKPRLNYTDGFLVYQKIIGCEVDNNSTGLMRSWDSFNGINVEEVNISMPEKTLQRKSNYLYEWDEKLQSDSKKMVSDLYYPVCVRNLQKYFHKEKNRMLSKVKPRVRLLKKTLTGSGMVQVTCLATGFYPRHINLTILRDGQPLSEDLVTGGILLPNVDGTYQMRKSLEVNAEELKESCYSCSATRLSLDNKLDIRLEYDPGPPIASIVFSVLVVLLVCLIVLTVAIVKWRKRHTGSQSSLQSEYTGASGEYLKIH
ncbi:class I histocompatibility antigen, F10 alpha chain-like [Chanos chanos]|uniref:Class I histocompatibility antigen, F10 alpha chain-like n=1 Tax=Chanos chanos TaxID=29144 RepID=A0A6J2UMX1_CHACN|nr:class I histocompatibility antigen, F10 alpha chain-like [Chanos chanos]